MAVDTETLQRRLTELLPRYRVLLHNDDYNSMDHVVHALLASVPSLSVDAAGRIMLEAHTHGLAEVIVCPKEQAEHYCVRLGSFGLTASMERAG